MGTTNPNVAAVNVPAAPAAITIVGGTLTEVTTILQDSLNVLDLIPATAVYAGLAQVILGIVSAAASRIKSDTGKPIDLSKIPIEAPLP